MKRSPPNTKPASHSSGAQPGALHTVLPREQVGPVTGERYEFQYHQAAADALLVLDDADVLCVYCEWHDDYVVESSGSVTYRFHQVKTRGLQRGPWKISDFFGAASTKRAAANPQRTPEPSIFSRMFEHLTTFGDRCSAFVFVTDAGVNSDFQALLDAISGAATLGSLSTAESRKLTSLAKGQAKSSGATEEEIFAFLKRFSCRSAKGALGDLHSCRLQMAFRIRELSEIDLRVSEAEKIGAELVRLVRDKSHVVLSPLPKDEAELRKQKALMLDDVLARIGRSWTRRSAHCGHLDRAIVDSEIGHVDTGIGPLWTLRSPSWTARSATWTPRPGPWTAWSAAAEAGCGSRSRQ